MRPQGYVAIAHIAGRPGWPSRAGLYQVIAQWKVKRFKFAGDKKTYVLRSEIERAVRTPEERK